MVRLSDIEPSFHFEEAFNLLCGDLLGEGVYRKVFECSIDPSLVVKVEKTTHSYMNAAEYRTWEESQFYEKVAHWLAPCVSISPHGTVMLQKRVEMLRPSDKLPEQIPGFLDRDVKPQNWGLFEGRYVCTDYAMLQSVLPVKLKKVDQWVW